jgi:hypothetical protein
MDWHIYLGKNQNEHVLIAEKINPNGTIARTINLPVDLLKRLNAQCEEVARLFQTKLDSERSDKVKKIELMTLELQRLKAEVGHGAT